jgi:plasmid maintenance system antidote protein VapI
VKYFRKSLCNRWAYRPPRWRSNCLPPNRILAIIKGRRVITADSALRLAQYFGNSAEFWLNLQQNYNLDVAKREKLAEIQAQVRQ